MEEIFTRLDFLKKKFNLLQSAVGFEPETVLKIRNYLIFPALAKNEIRKERHNFSLYERNMIHAFRGNRSLKAEQGKAREGGSPAGVGSSRGCS